MPKKQGSIRLNLLPPGIRARANVRNAIIIFAFFLLLEGAGVGAYYMDRVNKIKELHALKEKKEKEKEERDGIAAEAKSIRDSVQDIAERLKKISEFTGSGEAYAGRLREIAAQFPDGVQIVDMSVAGGSVSVKGWSKNKETWRRFKKSIEESEVFNPNGSGISSLSHDGVLIGSPTFEQVAEKPGAGVAAVGTGAPTLSAPAPIAPPTEQIPGQGADEAMAMMGFSMGGDIGGSASASAGATPSGALANSKWQVFMPPKATEFQLTLALRVPLAGILAPEQKIAAVLPGVGGLPAGGVIPGFEGMLGADRPEVQAEIMARMQQDAAATPESEDAP